MSVDLDAVTDDDVRRAAGLHDVHQAARSIQDVAGITDGGPAAMVLDEDTWADLSVVARTDQIRRWLAFERGLMASAPPSARP